MVAEAHIGQISTSTGNRQCLGDHVLPHGVAQLGEHQCGSSVGDQGDEVSAIAVDPTHGGVGVALFGAGVGEHLQADHQFQGLTFGFELLGQSGTAEHAPFLLIEGHQPRGSAWSRGAPAAGEFQQCSKAAGVVIRTDGMQWAVVVGANKNRFQVGIAAGQFEHEIDAFIAAAAEAVLLHFTAGRELFEHIAAHRHQAERVPLGMAGDGDGPEVVQDERRGAHQRNE